MSEDLSGLIASVGRVPREPLLVALGGGADSAVAAALAKEVAGADRVRLIHLDHRTPSAAQLADAAAELAAFVGLPLELRTLEVPSSGSWETAARQARRDALEEAAVGTAVIVTGHHRDDVAETVVAHLARGSGARGLSSLRARSGRYWRPLLSVPRAEIRAIADAMGLPYADDPSNDDIRHRRNLIRHEIMPVLGTLNPRVAESLARSASHLGEDDAELEAAAREVPIVRDREAWVAPLPLLGVLSPPVRTRALARLVRSARPPYGPSARELGRIDDVVAGSMRRTELADGLVCEREGPLLALYRPSDVPAAPAPVGLTVPGSAVFGDHAISAGEAARPVMRAGAVTLDASEVGDRLVVRATEHGERLALRNGSKLVRDALSEAGVPWRKRPGWPVVAAHGKIAWVVGARVAEWARVRPTTKRYLVLSLGR